MKVVESWLREWVDPALDTNALEHQLTMLGLEVDGVDEQGDGLDGVIVAQVLEVEKHPDADRLSVCKVSAGGEETVDVVCGAPNVIAGMKSPLAVPGITLPNGLKLRKSKIRGVVSNGMLCSAVELGLGEESDGIIALPDDAPAGMPLTEYLGLPDTVFDLDLTPNRGDCFSVLGVARDISALTGSPLKSPDIAPVAASTEDTLPVEIPLPEGCPSFAGRLIRNIDPAARSPLWLVERLRRSGLRGISPVVDITNYVMLELGQPLHAYDAARVQGAIRPRLAKQGEKVTLLDEKEVIVNDDTLVIADDSGAIGLAGIMGGLSTAVSDQTTDVFFEAAFWPQAFMAGRARSYGMHTDASLRFERGVDFGGQGRAVERATELLLEIAGGEAGPLVHHVAESHLPKRDPISLRRSRVSLLLGLDVEDEVVSGVLEGLGLTVRANEHGWDVVAPSYRFDITSEVDLIEEIVRIHGYDSVPETTEIAASPLRAVTESVVDLDLVSATLVARDYEEAITYSFIDERSNAAFAVNGSDLILSNPISSEMSVMRSSLLPGLVSSASANTARQQERVRLFEIGKSFHGTLEMPEEVVRVAAVACGAAVPEQWDIATQSVDFYDIKSDLVAILELAGDTTDIGFRSIEHPALQPGQSAAIVRGGHEIGIIGKLHPRVAKNLDLKRDAYVFELDALQALISKAPIAQPVSRFPVIRRDIAVIVREDISGDDLVQAVAAAAPEIMRDVRIFDIYKGPGIEAGLKSVAISLILQETSRTLTDDDADAAQAAAVQKLRHTFGAELRD
ncbi:MAG: phenylalanine--tRNA ligase subunit beta [Gammaproteobacteria bacterium]|nr:phenylalanine--tRNA ligase subunit beta [Gammaproteobacteria bacterium]